MKDEERKAGRPPYSHQPSAFLLRLFSSSLSPEGRVARWRRGRRITLIVLLLLGASVLLGHAGLLGFRGDDWARFDRRRVRVTEVFAGDRMRVRDAGGEETPVRLIGVAAPDAGGYWDAEARQSLAGRVDGKDVTLRLEATQTRAADGALLAYVYLTDADDLNLSMIRDGQAYADRQQAHSWQAQFDAAEGEARQKRRGLWRGQIDTQMPPWRQEWLRQQRDRRRERDGSQPTPAPPATRGGHR